MPRGGDERLLGHSLDYLLAIPRRMLRRARVEQLSRCSEEDDRADERDARARAAVDRPSNLHVILVGFLG